MSIYNGAGIVGAETGAALTSALGVTNENYENLSPLLVICALSSLLPLPFLDVLREAEGEEEGDV